jgi:hypothetical protein
MKKDYVFSLELLANLAAKSTNDHITLAEHVRVIEENLPPINILVLDDSVERHPFLLEKYAGLCRKITIVTTYSQAFQSLNDHQWVLISLDHDLGNDENGADHYLDDKGIKQFYDGMHVVRDIIFNNVDVAKVVVHSTNVVRAPQMVSDLNRAGIPSVWEPVRVKSSQKT